MLSNEYSTPCILTGIKFDDGREIRLLHAIHSRSDLSQIRNNPTAVLAAIDDYARSIAYLMNVGPDKGRIVSNLISEQKPRIMLELGGYIGYSCILFGAALRDASGSGAKYYSLERNPEFAAVIMCLVELAGLSEVVKVVVGPSDESLRRLTKEGKLDGSVRASGSKSQSNGAANGTSAGKAGIDLMFLDHYKPAYRTDLQLCEELGLIHEGTVLAGDNCIEPGNPAYLEYVRASPADKRSFLEKQEQDLKEGKQPGWDDRMSEKSRKQYERREGEGSRDLTVKGVPGIKYESSMVESFEPTGEKVSAASRLRSILHIEPALMTTRTG